ncbi:MAG: hypothetical protein LWX83_12315, partial [Anaerolineae bacterium]|nr:hypothetical protein [Anaerolineae bacterium]
TAWNGSLSTASIIEVTVDPALKDTTFTISDITPHSGYFHVGDSVNVFVNFSGLETGVAEPTGTVTVSDSYSICTITLPTKSCVLTFTAPGVKEIKANYSGDSIYLQKTSDAYSKESIIVESNTVLLSPSYYYNNSGVKGTPIPDLAAASLSVGQGLFMDVLVMPQNKAFVDDKKGQVLARYCPRNSDGTIEETSCVSTGTATVEASSAPSAGHAEVVISNLPKAGDYVLLISYEHLQDAYDPVIIGNTAADRINFTVSKGNLILIGEGATTCTYKNCLFLEDNNATVTFDAQLMINDQGDTDLANDQVVNLYPTFPQPETLAIDPQDLTGGALPSWTSNCYWQVSGSIRQLVCKAINLTQSMKLYNSFPTDDPNYQIYAAANPINIQIKKGTTITQTRTIFDGLYVGNKIDLLQTNLGVVEKYSPTSAVANANVYLSQDGGNLSDNLVIISSTPASACAWSGNSLKLTLANPATDSCLVAFKHAITSSINLVFTYNGDDVYNGSTLTRSVTVSKQEGINVDWTTGATWTIYDDNPVSLEFSCPNATDSTCKDFAPEVLSGISMTYTVPASCTLYQADTAVSNNTIILPSVGSTGTSLTVSDLKVICTSSGAKTQSLSFPNPSPAYNDFGIVASDATKTVTVAAKSVTMNGQVLMNNKASSISSYLNVVNASSQISNLFVAEEYWVVITLPSLPGSSSPTDNDFIKLSAITEIANNIDSGNSDCFSTSIGSTGSFKIGLTKNNSDWVAKCHFRLKNAMTISSSPATITASLSSPSFSATDYTVTVAASAVEKRPAVITTTITVPAGTTTPAANQYYARSNPSANITISDNHYMEDIGSLTATDFTVKLVDATTNAVDYSFDSTDCTLSDKTLTCPIPNNTYYSTGKVEKLSVEYVGDDVFAASSDTSPKQISIVPIPVELNLDSIQWVDSANAKHPFPEVLQCQNCSDKTPQYYVKSSGYTLSIPVTVPSSVKFENVTPVIGTTNIPGEVLTIKLANGARVKSNSATVSNGVATISFTALDIYQMYGFLDNVGLYYATFLARSISLEYATANQVSKATTSPLSRNQLINLRNPVTFAVQVTSSTYFDIKLIEPADDDICYDLYFETSASVTCEEGQQCWHTDDQQQDAGFYNNRTSEKMAINCSDSTVGYNNPSGCFPEGDDDFCYRYSSAADDNTIKIDNSILAASSAYQVCLVSPTMFGCVSQGWPP